MGIKSQIQLYDIIGYCEARVENNLPTYFAIGLKNLKISKVINAICNFFNNVRNQSTKTISLSDNAIILKEGSFSYDLYSFEMNSYFDLIFFKNELIIECHYSPVSMIYKGSFERPVKIGPLILSSATNSK